jgi:hypothetical protein
MKPKTGRKQPKVTTKAPEPVDDGEASLRKKTAETELDEKIEDLKGKRLDNWQKRLKLAKSVISSVLLLPLAKFLKAIPLLLGASSDPVSAQESLNRPSEAPPPLFETHPVKDSNIQPNWLSQQYRDRFRSLISAIEALYKALDEDVGAEAKSEHLERILKDLDGEDADTVDASIAYSIKQCYETDKKQQTAQPGVVGTGGPGELLPYPLKSGHWFKESSKPQQKEPESTMHERHMRQALLQTSSMLQRGEASSAVKVSLYRVANTFLQQLRERNPKLYSDVSDVVTPETMHFLGPRTSLQKRE